MISDNVEYFVHSLAEKTKNGCIDWKYAYEYIANESVSPSFLHNMLRYKEGIKCIVDYKSFYITSGAGVVALMEMIKQGDNNHVSSALELWCQIRPNMPVEKFDWEGMQEDFRDLQLAISNYKNNEMPMPDALYHFFSDVLDSCK